MSKVKKINVRDIDLDLLQNSRIDDVEKEVAPLIKLIVNIVNKNNILYFCENFRNSVLL